MVRTPYGPFTRRAVLGLLGGAAATAPAWAQARPRVVTILGDSITAGYGLPAGAALPARLQAQLTRTIPNVRVRGAGVSGDTTAGGLARVDFSVQGDTTLCVVALGANDLLQGLDPKVTRANLEKIVQKLKARRIPVMLAGVSAPSAIGRSYSRDFGAVFTDLSRKYGLPLYPDLLAGIGADRRYRQPDGLHPHAAGVNIIANRLAPAVARALTQRR
jgi:acyl-CoA thioesterase-1